MTNYTTRRAVEAFVAAAVPDPQYVEAFTVAACAALRLAEVLDVADTGSGAANASRELRAQFEQMRLMLADPWLSPAELRDRRANAAKERAFEELVAEITAVSPTPDPSPESDPDDEGPTPPTFAH